MNFEDLDADTKGLIESMCYNTGKTKEQAILALCEFGMVSMIAAIRLDKQDKIMKVVFDAINNDAKLKKTAEAYGAYWSIGV
jgi:PhoPQ-activated pathogenicity-related protein